MSPSLCNVVLAAAVDVFCSVLGDVGFTFGGSVGGVVSGDSVLVAVGVAPGNSVLDAVGALSDSADDGGRVVVVSAKMAGSQSQR